MVVALLEEPMARKKAPKTSPVRLTEEAMKWANIAAGFTRESATEYVSRIVTEYARADAERLFREAQEEEARKHREEGKGGKPGK